MAAGTADREQRPRTETRSDRRDERVTQLECSGAGCGRKIVRLRGLGGRNFGGTARDGAVRCSARLGRSRCAITYAAYSRGMRAGGGRAGVRSWGGVCFGLRASGGVSQPRTAPGHRRRPNRGRPRVRTRFARRMRICARSGRRGRSASGSALLCGLVLVAVVGAGGSSRRVGRVCEC